MRLAIAWIAVLLAASGCSINHRSDAFACESDTDCTEPGRICSGNVCVLVAVDAGRDAVRDSAMPTDGRVPDAREPDPDAPPNGCPDICSSCETDDDGARTCVIDCDQNPARCGAPITCPAGLACDVRCNRQGSCRAGVSCGNATACAVSCTGQSSCEDVRCGSAPCFIDCVAEGTCSGISCAESCACDVDCASGSVCEDVVCPGVACGAFDGGCNSNRIGCNTCE